MLPVAAEGRRERAVRDVWDSIERRAGELGLEAPSRAVVSSRRGVLVLARRGARLAAALVGRDAVTSLVLYELDEALGEDPDG
jgi:hypothetical protein